jgi:DNA polymerase III delta prime subunit
MRAHMEERHLALKHRAPRHAEWERRGLNFKQRQVLAAATFPVPEDDACVTLIQGPPGTGKTTTAVEIVCTWLTQYSNTEAKVRDRVHL